EGVSCSPCAPALLKASSARTIRHSSLSILNCRLSVKLNTIGFPLPFHECLHGFVFGQSETIVDVCRIPISIFGPLPEFPLIITGEWGPVLLGLVHKYSGPLSDHFIGAQRDRHFDLIDPPFVPGSAVQPQPAIL